MFAMESDEEVPTVVDKRLIPVVSDGVSRSVGRRADKLVSAAEELCRRKDGSIDGPETVFLLRTALQKVDPAYKRVLQGSCMMDALAANINRQGRGDTQWKLKRAVVEQIAHGVGRDTFSMTAVKERLRFWGVVEGPGEDAGRLGKRQAPPSVEATLGKKRKERHDKLPITVNQAVAEFAYCYCKFTENKYVCLLTKQHVWTLYCMFHERDGGYYPNG